MNLYWVYDIPNGLFAILCILFFIFIAIAGLLLFKNFIFTRIIPQSHNDVVSFFMAGMNAIYGITLGLIAVGAWENFNEVDSKVSQEAATLSALYQSVKSVPAPLGDTLKAQLQEYTSYTIKDAWPKQQQGLIPHGGTQRLSRFQNSLMEYEPKTKSGEFMLNNAITQLNRLFELRRYRLQSVTQGLPASLWYVIIFGAIVNIVITWFFKTDKFHVHLLMIAMFAALLGSLVFLIAAMDNPFRGEFSVSSEAFELILENMIKG
jgi:hypothetical protein